MTYTPDSLREAAKDMFNADAEICRSHADAWEAEREAAAVVRENLRLCAQGARNNRDRADLFKRERDAAEEECDTLRKRLKAAERITSVARALRTIWTNRGHGCAEEKLLLADLAHAVDALAGEEKP
jgi:hypothetical protein